MSGNNFSSLKILILFILFGITYHIAGYIGHFGYDDMQYAQMAFDLLHGKLNLNDHYAHRIAVVAPLALSYKLFGINDTASALPAIFAYLISLVFVYNMLKNNRLQLILGLCLTALCNWFLFYSDKIMPDIFVAMFAFGAIVFLHKARIKPTNSTLFSIAFSAFVLLAFLSKGSVVLAFPLFITIFFYDIYNKQHQKFWLFSIVSGIILFSIYFGIMYGLAGSITHRFQAIANGSYLNLCSYDQQPFHILLKRIGYQFVNLFVKEGLAVGLIFILPTIFSAKIKNWDFWTKASLLLLISANFMTVSFKTYSPMCLDPRHYLYIVPAIAVAAARSFGSNFHNKRYKLLLIVTSAGFAMWSFLLDYNNFLHIYLPILVLTALLFLVKKTYLIGVFMVLAFVVQPLNMINYAHYSVRYKLQKEIVFNEVINQRTDKVVLTDEVQARLLNYYVGFDSVKTGRFKNVMDFEADSTQNFVFLFNPNTFAMAGLQYNDLPYSVRNNDSTNLIFIDRLTGIEISHLPKGFASFNKKMVLTTKNNFEEKSKFWYVNEAEISTQHGYLSTKSNRFGMYSSTYVLPTDSIHFQQDKSYFMEAEFLLFLYDKAPNIQLIFSVEDSTGGYIWKNYDVSRHIRAYGLWEPIYIQFDEVGKNIRPNSLLKIYLLNEDLKEVYVDDFTIKISEIER
ncbi:MAG: glycosyltransferase family 39 protein [Flavobacteriales bacterium]|nr:glycosyltransferase family 39 protein [Flavobacteriales bacterium]